MSAEVERVDRYTIRVNGFNIRATEDQERRIREMDDEQIDRLVTVMGWKF